MRVVKKYGGSSVATPEKIKNIAKHLIEKSKEGQEIVEFASAGPKNYTYKLDTGITHTKIKGFSLNIAASSTIDFQKIKEIVTSKEEIEIPIEQNTITRDKSNWTVQTKTFNKIYRQVYDKRIILNDLSTVPYGFKY